MHEKLPSMLAKDYKAQDEPMSMEEEVGEDEQADADSMDENDDDDDDAHDQDNEGEGSLRVPTDETTDLTTMSQILQLDGAPDDISAYQLYDDDDDDDDDQDDWAGWLNLCKLDWFVYCWYVYFVNMHPLCLIWPLSNGHMNLLLFEDSLSPNTNSYYNK